jgi:hypothetical protein
VTIREWLDQRTPPPPPRLRAGVDDALGPRSKKPASETASESIAAAEQLLGELLARPTAGRESALDLLVVDALVTYAFEAAATEPALLAARAADAMTRFSAVA